MNHKDRAVECFEQGFNCSQAVLSAYAEEFGLSLETALKIAAGFGGGMGRMAETCGAVTGAFMVLGLKYWDSTMEKGAAKAQTYAQVQEFAKRFAARHGSIICKELLGCDISTSEGMEQAKQQQLFKTRCTPLVGDAAELLEEII